MKIKIFLLCILGLLQYQLINAQEFFGTVVDNKYNPIEGVTVIMETSDSVFVTGTITNLAGEFKIKSSPYKCILRFQHLLYIPKSIILDRKDIGTIVLDDADHLLEEVVVKGNVPIVKIDNGKMSYNLSLLTQNRLSTNTFDALSEIPGIREDNGGLTITGNKKIAIIIDGKLSTMTNEQIISLLKSTPIEQVEKVEVMYSAPPQYHVRGAAINIVMKKRYKKDFKGELNTCYTNKYLSNWLGSVNLKYSTDKISTDLMYSINTENSKTLIDLESSHLLNDKLNIITQKQNVLGRELKHNAHMSFNYNLCDKNELNIAYTTTFTPNTKGSLETIGNYMNSTSKQINSSKMHNISMEYKLHSLFSAGIDFTSFNSNMNQTLYNQTTSNINSSFDVVSKQNINKTSAHIDGEKKIHKGWDANYGLSLNYTLDTDCQEYKNIKGELEYENTDMKLKEYTANIYAGFSKSDTLGNSFSFSLAGEYYKLNNYKKWAIYPQISLLYNISKLHMIQFSFSSDKIYPSYWQMQNSISYIDGYSEVHGSPELRPMKEYQITCSYIYKQKYIATIFYGYIPDYFQQAVYQSSQKMALIYKTLNWDFMQSTGLSLTIPFPKTKWLDSQLTIMGYNLRNKCHNFFDISFDRNKWIGQMSLNNSFIISNNIALNISMLYQTPTIQGTYDLEQVFDLSLGAKWIFAKRKASLSIKYNDILEMMVPMASVNYMKQDLKMDMGFYTRSLTLSFVYRFGGYKEEKKKEIDTSRFGH